MKRPLLAPIVLGLVLLASYTSSNASLIPFTIMLSGQQETPASPSTAAGGGIALFDDVANTISLSVFFAGLSGTAAQSHIHLAPAGTNGGVIVSFVPFTPQATSGSIVGENLLFPADAATISALLAGDTYFNIHTSVFPGGEIRGQLLPVVQAVSVPEPPSILLLLAGLIGLMLLSRAFTLPSVDLRLRDPALQSG